eukprot:m.490929 g.490929  ORF g.490929 m.490929 type:complete len:941 (+) comp28859_c0_seq1:2-2824(+)
MAPAATPTMLLLAAAVVASIHAAGAVPFYADTCSLYIQSNTACSRNPFQKYEHTTFDECCAHCTQNTQCFAMTHHTDGNCFLSLASGYTPTPQKGTTCATRQPKPPPPAPSGLDPRLDCALRVLALEYGTNIANVVPKAKEFLFEALQLEQGCNMTLGQAEAHVAKTQPRRQHPRQLHSVLPTAQLDYYVDPEHGSDANSGKSASAAFKTVAKAAQTIEISDPSLRQPTTVHLLAGHHVLTETLALDRRHSGTRSAPVVFQGAAGTTAADVVVTGAVPLTGLAWQRDPKGYYSAKVSVPVKSLYAGNQRQFLARWPNGNPETYCPRDLHGGKCTGYAQAGNQVTKGTSKGSTIAPTNVQVFAANNGTLIAEGIMYPFDKQYNFSIAVPESWNVRKKTWTKFIANQGGDLSRFDLNTTFAFWDTTVPTSMYYRKEQMSKNKWSKPQEALLHIYQSEYWGSWVFRLSGVDEGKGTFSFSEGGFQESRGGSIGGTGGRGLAQDYFVENVFEELDAPREFYYSSSDSELYWYPANASVAPADAQLTAPSLDKLLVVAGTSPSNAAQYITIQGITFQGASPTYMKASEPTSGGDWAVHRGAAVMFENATNITLQHSRIANNEGNGLILSRYVRSALVTECELFNIGETPIVLLGAADLMDGRSGTQPVHNTITHNYVHNWGIWNRQAGGYFEGLARQNDVSFNVFHDGPRAGANFNDGFGGGLVFKGNLLFNVVQDTGEHGSTNSWDRQPMLYNDDQGVTRIAPLTRQIVYNFVFRNSFRGPTSNKWALDKDDGSSEYYEANNVLLYGAIKDRDGLDRMAANNLLLFPDKMPFPDTTNTKMAMNFQVNGLGHDAFVNNTVITMTGYIYQCTAASIKDNSTRPITANNTFITPNMTSLPFQESSCETANSFSDWQAAGNDAGSKQSSQGLTFEQIIDMARAWLIWQ